jgi:hypothetical protein
VRAQTGLTSGVLRTFQGARHTNTLALQLSPCSK